MKKKLNFGRRKWLMATFRASPSCGHYNETFPSNWCIRSITGCELTRVSIIPNKILTASASLGLFGCRLFIIVPISQRKKGESYPATLLPGPKCQCQLFQEVCLGGYRGTKFFTCFHATSEFSQHCIRYFSLVGL